jgi:PAS domain S-box-containing protein
MSAQKTPLDSKGGADTSRDLRINIFGLSAAFILLLAILGAAALLGLRQNSAQRDVEKSLDVINGLNRVLTELLDAETAQRGYILTGDPSYLVPFNQAAPDVPGDIAHLQQVTQSETQTAASLVALRDIADQKLAELRGTIAMEQQGQHDAALARIRQGVGKDLMDRARGIIGNLSQDETRRLIERRTVAVDTDRLLQFGVVGSVLALLALATIGLRVIRSQFRKVVRAQLAAQSANRSFQLLVQGVTDYAIFMLDPQGSVTNWNPGAARIKGYTEREIVGQHFSRFYTPEDRADGVPARALATAAKEGKYEAEGWRMRKDGSRFWANVVIDRIQDASGNVIGFAKVTRDITERRETQQRLEAAREQLYQSQKMDAIGQLTGGVAHDFNNLLTIIIGNLDNGKRVLESWQSGAQERLMRAIDQALVGAHRAVRLTAHLLAFARRQPLEAKVLDINKLLRHLSGFLKPSLGEQVELEVVGAGGIWQVVADEAQLETAILNLALNARDAMPDGGKLTIEASNIFLDEIYCSKNAEVRPGQYVEISVSDNGVGMSSEAATHAFEPFFTTKQAGQGTGLGLSQVYGFVKQIEGHVKIYSELGHGTTVRIYLPRGQGVSMVGEQELPNATMPAAHGKETILLVEDDDDVRAFIAETLTALKYAVLQAADGPSALKMLENRIVIDLMVTDVILPGPNGREVARAAQNARPNLKVLFMTGYSRNAIVHNGRLDRDVHLIQKPFTQAALATKIRSLLDLTVPAVS